MNNYKKIIDSLFCDRYDYLSQIAFNLVSKLNRRDLASTLLADAYQYLIENEEKLNDKVLNNNMTEAIVVNFMTKQINWNKTKFKKTWIDINPKHIQADFNDKIEVIDDTIDEEEYLAKEKTSQDKTNHIYATAASLNFDQQILFNLYLSGTNTSGKLAKHTGLARTTCYYLLKNLKKTLTQNYKEDN